MLDKAARLRGVLLHESGDVNAPETLAFIRGLTPDLVLTLGWSSKFGPELLALPGNGCVNVHPSLLPRFRGRYPLTAAVFYKLRQTGITYHLMDERFDHGAILLQQPVWLDNRETSLSLLGKCARAVVDTLDSFLDAFAGGELEAIDQDEQLASQSPRFSSADALVDWQAPTHRIDLKVRAFYPWLPCYTYHEHQRIEFAACTPGLESPEHMPGEVLAIKRRNTLQVATSDGSLWLAALASNAAGNGRPRGELAKVQVGDILVSYPVEVPPAEPLDT